MNFAEAGGYMLAGSPDLAPLAFENAARLAPAGIVASARNSIAEGDALAMLAVFFERSALQALLATRAHRERSSRPAHRRL